MATQGKKLRGVRLDSGDMVSLSREVRAILDREGLPEVKIYASGAFDEHKIAEAVGRGAQIDAFGVGTKFGVSADAPYTDMIYKLVRYEGRAILKLSSGKITLAGEKQVYRVIRGNRLSGHVIARRGERLDGEPLLQPVMRAGKRCRPKEPLDVIRTRCRTDLAMLEEKYKLNRSPAVFPVSLSPGLQQLQDETRKSLLEAILKE